MYVVAPEILHIEHGGLRSLQQDENSADASSPSVNLETMAIIFTGQLGVIGYVVQSKIAIS
jgi:hypothetical protein